MVQDSGFEDVVFLSGLCTSGSLAGALSGNHYNRAWRAHPAMAEALERLLLKRFRHEIHPDMSKEMFEALVEPPDALSKERLKVFTDMLASYQSFKDDVRGLDNNSWCLC